MNLETLVRPFVATRALSTRRVISSSVKIATQTAGATWGVAGNLPNPVEEDIPTLDGGGFKTECCSDGFFELSAETEDVKVYNQKNPNAVAEEDYIVVRRRTIMKGNKKEKECGTQAAPGIARAFAATDAYVYSGLFGANDPNRPQKDKCTFQMTFKNV